jgi:hypothetical protein
MEEKKGQGKGKRVMIWLRFGYTFFKKARVGYDLAWNDEALLISLNYGPHLFVLWHIRSADSENM